MNRVIYCKLVICLLLSLFASKAIAQKEEPTLVEQAQEITRLYDTNRYTDYLCQTGSGKPMETRRSWDKIVQETEERIRNEEAQLEVKPTTVGLVFHILYTSDEREAKEAVASQIAALNRDFNNKSFRERQANDPTGAFAKLASSASFTFVPARNETIDSETGIATLRASEAIWRNWDEMKDPERGGASSIAASENINIWVCHLPENLSSYASSPYQLNGNDGIVIDARFFGENRDSKHPYNQGKTLTHLIGNYMGLSPLWGSTGRCSDDKVADTPISNDPNYECPETRHLSYCDGNPEEMTMNFMDATPDECQTMFTKGQVRRMHAVLKSTRVGLVNTKSGKL